MKQWHLKAEDFFHGIESVKREFIKKSRRLSLAKNDIVFFEGDAGGSCFYVESGLLRIFSINSAGKESIFFLRREGDMFGLSEVLDNVPRKANAQTLAPSVLYRMGSEDFSAMLAKHPQAARRAVVFLGRRVRYLGERLSSLSACGVRERLIKLLVYIAYDNLHDSRSWNNPVELPVRLSQEQLAAMTGSTQPTVSALLQDLQNEGLLDVARKKILLRNPLALLSQVEMAATPDYS